MDDKDRKIAELTDNARFWCEKYEHEKGKTVGAKSQRDHYRRRAEAQELEITKLYDRLQEAHDDAARAWSLTPDRIQRQEIDRRTSTSVQNLSGVGLQATGEVQFRGEHFNAGVNISKREIERTGDAAGLVAETQKQLRAAILESACHRFGIRAEEQDPERRIEELERQLRLFYLPDGSAIECNSIEEAKRQRIQAAQTIRDFKRSQQAQGEAVQSYLYRCDRCGSESSVNSRGEKLYCNMHGCFGECLPALTPAPAAVPEGWSISHMEPLVAKRILLRDPDGHSGVIDTVNNFLVYRFLRSLLAAAPAPAEPNKGGDQ